MNIKMQCCGLVILFVIGCFFRQQKRVRIYTERIFVWTYRMVAVCVSLDILSLVAIDGMGRLPLTVVDLACKFYNTSLVLVVMLGLLYAAVDAYPDEVYVKFLRGSLAVAAAEAVCIFLLPIEYVTDGAGKFLYTFGPSVYATYISGLIFMVATVVVLVRRREYINSRRFEAVSLWLLCWLGSSLIQLCIKELLLVGFGATMGVLVLYVKLENPETYIDRQTGMFNSNALTYFLRERHEKGQHFPILVLVLEDYSNIGLDKEEVEAIRLEVEDCLQKTGAWLFRKSEDEMVMLFAEGTPADAAKDMLVRRFSETWGRSRVVLHPGWIFLSDAQLLTDSDELGRALRHVRQDVRQTLGRYDVEITGEVLEQMRKEKRVERLLLDGIENDRIEVYYQPIYNTKERCFTCAEALVRIYDGENHLIRPSVFIEVAEKNGMILKLGRIVFEKVCRLMKEEHPEQYGLRYIEVNLSTVQCADKDLADDYISILKKYDLPPERINLEITESASLLAKETLQRNMERMMDYGIRFSLDDFGTGQSNLNYIMDMPVDIVKFDREMSQAFFENDKAHFVMNAAISMVHGMEMKTVSEGIETEEQLRKMEDMGISYIQGYYFSKPLPQDAFLSFLKEKNGADEVAV